MIELKDIRRDATLQMRDTTSERAVNDFANNMAAGAKFPAVIVFNDGQTNWLVDGYHRFAAAEKVGLTSILADVRHGDYNAALDFAYSANKANVSIRRTNRDIRKAVTMALADPRHRGEPNTKIAELCGVSESFVRKLKNELAQCEYENSNNFIKPTPTENLQSIVAESVAKALTEQASTIEHLKAQLADKYEDFAPAGCSTITDYLPLARELQREQPMAALQVAEDYLRLINAYLDLIPYSSAAHKLLMRTPLYFTPVNGVITPVYRDPNWWKIIFDEKSLCDCLKAERDRTMTSWPYLAQAGEEYAIFLRACWLTAGYDFINDKDSIHGILNHGVYVSYWPTGISVADNDRLTLDAPDNAVKINIPAVLNESTAWVVIENPADDKQYQVHELTQEFRHADYMARHPEGWDYRDAWYYQLERDPKCLPQLIVGELSCPIIEQRTLDRFE